MKIKGTNASESDSSPDRSKPKIAVRDEGKRTHLSPALEFILKSRTSPEGFLMNRLREIRSGHSKPGVSTPQFLNISNLNIPLVEESMLSEKSRDLSAKSTPRYKIELDGIKEINENLDDEKRRFSKRGFNINQACDISLDGSPSSMKRSEAKRLDYKSPVKKLKKPVIRPKVKPISVQDLVNKFVKLSKEQEDTIIGMIGKHRLI